MNFHYSGMPKSERPITENAEIQTIGRSVIGRSDFRRSVHSVCSNASLDPFILKNYII